MNLQKYLSKTHNRSAIIGVALLAATLTAQAATISYGSFSVAEQSTSWNETVSVPQFDPSLGTLTGVSFDLVGRVGGDSRVESDNGSPSTVTLNLAATVTLTAPGGEVIATSLPLSSETLNLSASDGTLDFGGTSGASLLAMSASDSVSGTSPNFALFTGLGLVNMEVAAVGASSSTGSGNLTTLFSTNASADVSVTYTYDAAGIPPAPVPEPSSAFAFIALAFGMIARRRR